LKPLLGGKKNGWYNVSDMREKEKNREKDDDNGHETYGPRKEFRLGKSRTTLIRPCRRKLRGSHRGIKVKEASGSGGTGKRFHLKRKRKRKCRKNCIWNRQGLKKAREERV